ncbi:MAG: hypothetical protein JTT12_05535 [Candidatus Brockarchaeota archaeon]|nr:hypothetical protein [Candidatus Brockarchaeota archaeon]
MLSKGLTSGDLVTPQNVEIVDIDTNPNVTKVGSWTSISRNAAVGLSCLVSNNTGDYIEYKFVGSGIWVRYMLSYDGGIMQIFIDGNSVGYVDSYAPTTETQQGSFVYAFPAVGLKIGVHDIKVVVTGNKNPASAGSSIYLDAFTVEHQPGALQVYSMIEGSPPVTISNFLGRGDLALVFEASPWGYDYDADVLKVREQEEFFLPPTSVPTTEGVVYSGSVYINSMHVANSTSSAITITIRDNAPTPNTFVFSKSIPANDTIQIFNVVKPYYFMNGIRAVASAAGLYLIASGY